MKDRNGKEIEVGCTAVYLPDGAPVMAGVVLDTDPDRGYSGSVKLNRWGWIFYIGPDFWEVD